ncbi:MAG: T9SS type A sorting domain-containing protein [Crocinitomix sp.]|nr:T9SS type A sorting domain-containing protein [Crocinitomix sp.]
MWYFGCHVGLDFNYDPPLPIEDSEICCTACSSISDSLGNLLFYSDGAHNYDRNQIEMPTSDEIGGYNHHTQSPIIIRKPNSNNLYYLFKMTGGGYSQELRYSVIDMNLNGGLGDISDLKGVVLMDSVCDKITAVRHENGRDAWVITHSLAGNKFYSHLLTPDGVIAEPIVSEVGILIDNSEWDYYVNGQLQSSPLGNKIAMATRHNDFQVLDFDKSSGVISNPITFPNIAIYPEWGQYGCEFSPSGELLYITNPHFSPSYSLLYQYNLTADDILGSEVIISNEEIVWGQMQIAPDGKIYIACSGELFLSVIHDLDAIGTDCNLILESINLSEPEVLTHASRGLPNLINTIHLEYLSVAQKLHQEKYTLSIFPNPYDHSQLLNFSRELKPQTRISIYDVAGKIIFLNTDFSGSELRLNDQVLIPGIYFVYVENNSSEKNDMFKLLVQ